MITKFAYWLLRQLEFRRIDYSLKVGDYIYFSYYTRPRPDQLIVAKIVDINFAYRMIVIQYGLRTPFVTTLVDKKRVTN